jgi:hypothetical protein
VLVDDLGSSSRTITLALRLGQDVLEVGDLGFDLGQIVDDLLPLQAARRRSCMSRIACAWISSMSSSSIRPARATRPSATPG